MQWNWICLREQASIQEIHRYSGMKIHSTLVPWFPWNFREVTLTNIFNIFIIIIYNDYTAMSDGWWSPLLDFFSWQFVHAFIIFRRFLKSTHPSRRVTGRSLPTAAKRVLLIQWDQNHRMASKEGCGWIVQTRWTWYVCYDRHPQINGPEFCCQDQLAKDWW